MEVFGFCAEFDEFEDCGDLGSGGIEAFLFENFAHGGAVVDKDVEPATDVGVVTVFSFLDDEVKLLVVLCKKAKGLSRAEFKSFAD